MKIFFNVLVILDVLVILTHGYAVEFSQPTVHHYARHGLCKNFLGRKYFYNVMKQHLCHLKENFTANLVNHLCKHKNKSLDVWVAELFDRNRDGRISYHERIFYRKKDD